MSDKLSKWGWDGGSPTAPEHVSKHNLTDAKWVRISCQGSAIHTSKTSPPNWGLVDKVIGGWFSKGVNIILSTPFHPSDLTDSEIVPWMIAFNQSVIARYGSKIIGIQPLNEPWHGDEDATKPDSWPYKNKRVGASHNAENFWVTGAPGPNPSAITESAKRWYELMRQILNGVHSIAAPLNINVYGPHWSNPRYIQETDIGVQLGLLEGVDVFTFGCAAKGTALGPRVGENGWATYIDDIIPLLGGRPWSCLEFHLNHLPNGPDDATQAAEIKIGVEHWVEKGCQAVLIHTGLQSWDTSLPVSGDGKWQSMSGYIDDKTTEQLRVIQVAASGSSPYDCEYQEQIDRMEAILLTLQTPSFPEPSKSIINSKYNVTSRGANEIAAYLEEIGLIVKP